MSKSLQRLPLNGTFELTGRCNMRCKMCFVRVDEKAILKTGEKERSTKEWIDLAEKAAEAGTLNLLLTGGEITLRTDFTEIYSAIAQMGFILTVYTNATMIDDKIMKAFEKYPPHTIGVTIYGANNDTYLKLCGNPHGFDQFCEGLSRLKELPSLLDMRTTLVRDNIHDYESMKAFTKKQFSEDKILHVTSRIFPAVRGSISEPEKVRLSSVEMFKFLHNGLISAKHDLESGHLDVEQFFPQDKYDRLINEIKRRRPILEGEYLFSGCGAGISSYFISWSGNMYACGALPTGFTKPFENGFQQAWNELPMKYPFGHLNEKCANCDLLSYCDSCPAYRILETGSWHGVPKEACSVAKLNKELIDSFQSHKSVEK